MEAEASDPREPTIAWASALMMAGGLLILASSVVIATVYHGADLPLGMPTDMMNDQLRSSPPAPILFGWALVTGGVATWSGFVVRRVSPGEATAPGAAAIAAGLLALGPGGGFLWGTVLAVVGGSLAVAAQPGAV